MKPVFREYQARDYEQCEALVNEAWAFDQNFRPQELTDLAKCIYTRGSVSGSNYKCVVEVDGFIVGFLFGLNECLSKPKRNILFGLATLWRLLRIKGMERQDKRRLVDAMNAHEVNRSKVVSRGKSEVVLFVVGRRHQGLGFGKKLWLGFESNCKSGGVKKVIVETNKLGASSFYEKMGFKHLGNFDSPLHEYASKGGQACMYEYVCK